MHAALGQWWVLLKTPPLNITLLLSASHHGLFLTLLAVLHCGRIHNSFGGRISEVAAQSQRNLHCCCVHRLLSHRAVQYYSGMCSRRLWSCVWHTVSVFFLPDPAPTRSHCKPLKLPDLSSALSKAFRQQTLSVKCPQSAVCCSSWFRWQENPHLYSLSHSARSGSWGCSPLLSMIY